MSGERVCIVAVRDPTFERCRAGFYPCPRSYPRCEAAFTYLALYRPAPVSAVTHYARVTDRFEDDGRWMGGEAWDECVAPVLDGEDRAMVFTLRALLELGTPVANDMHGVRGAWYCSLETLRTTDRLSALRARTDGGGAS